MVAASEGDTVLMFRALHNTARVFKNKVAAEVDAIQRAKGERLQFEDVATLVSGARGRKAEAENDPDGGIWSAGQVKSPTKTCSFLKISMHYGVVIL